MQHIVALKSGTCNCMAKLYIIGHLWQNNDIDGKCGYQAEGWLYDFVVCTVE